MSAVLAGVAVFLAVVASGPGGGRSGRLRLGGLRMPPDPAGRVRGEGGEEALRVRPWLLPRLIRRRAPAQVGVDAATVALLAGRVASLSRAGLPLTRVWPVLAEHDRVAAALCARVSRALAMGATTAEGLRLAAPGAGPVAWLALACAVAERAGAPMAEVLDGVAAVIRADQDAQRQRESAMAGPRATATLLSWLPLAGIGLSLLTGVDAVGVLLSTAAGRGCLVAGLALWAGGGVWMRRLLRRSTLR